MLFFCRLLRDVGSLSKLVEDTSSLERRVFLVVLCDCVRRPEASALDISVQSSSDILCPLMVSSQLKVCTRVSTENCLKTVGCRKTIEFRRRSDLHTLVVLRCSIRYLNSSRQSRPPTAFVRSNAILLTY